VVLWKNYPPHRRGVNTDCLGRFWKPVKFREKRETLSGPLSQIGKNSSGKNPALCPPPIKSKLSDTLQIQKPAGVGAYIQLGMGGRLQNTPILEKNEIKKIVSCKFRHLAWTKIVGFRLMEFSLFVKVLKLKKIFRNSFFHRAPLQNVFWIKKNVQNRLFLK
jgi:hypothetical protein